jgi:two-component system, NarL family, nitrate/nitrite response regulator NarL
MLSITPAAKTMRTAATRDHDEPIRAVLVGGDMLSREGLKRFLTDGEVLIVDEVDAAGHLADSGKPDQAVELAILFDHSGQGEALLTELTALKRRWPGVRTVMIAAEPRVSLLAQAIDAGADGYLCKDVTPETLIQSLRLIMRGLNVFPVRLVSELVRASQSVGASRGDAARVPSLTGREKDILHGLLSGLSNKMISSQLGISEATVKAQLRHLLRKLSVENRTQAALWAVEHNILRNESAA